MSEAVRQFYEMVAEAYWGTSPEGDVDVEESVKLPADWLAKAQGMMPRKEKPEAPVKKAAKKSKKGRKK